MNIFIKLFANVTMFVNPDIGAYSQVYCAASTEIIEKKLEGEFIGPKYFTALLWVPSQTEICPVSSLVNQENIELCWSKSVALIQTILPSWSPRVGIS
jgi:hypothetical protein